MTENWRSVALPLEPAMMKRRCSHRHQKRTTRDICDGQGKNVDGIPNEGAALHEVFLHVERSRKNSKFVKIECLGNCSLKCRSKYPVGRAVLSSTASSTAEL